MLFEDLIFVRALFHARADRIKGMEERERKGRGAGCAIGCAVFMILPVLYVLGLGPAALLAKNDPSTEVWLVPIYYPLLILAEKCPPVETVLTWYIELWGV